MKNIKVEDKIWEKLMKLKIDWKKQKVSDVIKEFIENSFKIRR